MGFGLLETPVVRGFLKAQRSICYHVKKRHIHRRRKWGVPYACEGSMYRLQNTHVCMIFIVYACNTERHHSHGHRKCYTCEANVKFKKNDTAALREMFSIFIFLRPRLTFRMPYSILCGPLWWLERNSSSMPKYAAWTSRFVLFLLFLSFLPF